MSTRRNGIKRIETSNGVRYEVATRIAGKQIHRRFRSRREADEYLTATRRLHHEREVGLANEVREITVAECCEWYRQEISPEKAKSTQEKDRFALSLLEEHFDTSRLMSSIRADELSKFQRWCRGEYDVVYRRKKWNKQTREWDITEKKGKRKRTPAAVNSLSHTWRHMFAEAEKAGHIASNPWRKVENLKADPPNTRYLTMEELKQVLTQAKLYGADKEAWENRPDDYDQENLSEMILWLAFQGTRRGEMFALMWGDIDWAGETVEVVTLKRGKSKAARKRRIPLHPDVLAMLKVRMERRHGKTQGKIMNLDGSSADLSDVPVFPEDVTLLRKFKICCDRAKVPPARIHDLRHTTGTLLAASESLTTVAAILGHTRVSTTERYSHTAAETMAKAVQRLPRLGDIEACDSD